MCVLGTYFCIGSDIFPSGSKYPFIFVKKKLVEIKSADENNGDENKSLKKQAPPALKQSQKFI